MKKQLIFYLVIFLIGLTVFILGGHIARAGYEAGFQGAQSHQNHLLAAATPLPTAQPIPISSQTPADRVLPPVGKNAGLVIGAGVLVLIILIGVLSVRMRPKH